MLVTPEPIDWLEAAELRVVLIVGTNGSGKTTSIAKLAAYLKGQGRSVMLAAADTFRAAAGDQLEIWAAARRRAHHRRAARRGSRRDRV